MRINSVPDVKCFVIIKMCYVHNQCYYISCATLYIIHEADQKSMKIVALKPLDFKQNGTFFIS